MRVIFDTGIFFGNYVLQGGGGVSFGVAEAFGYRGGNTYAR